VEPKEDASRRLLAKQTSESDKEDQETNTPGEVIDLDPGGNAVPPLKAPALPPIDARGGTVVLDQSNASTVPSLLGLSMREAIEAAHKAGFELQVVGSGVARQQQPPAGSYLPPGSKIAVRFAR
jgi:hypothetical protein